MTKRKTESLLKALDRQIDKYAKKIDNILCEHVNEPWRNFNGIYDRIQDNKQST